MKRYLASLSLVMCLQGSLFGSHQSAAQESNAAYWGKLATHIGITLLAYKKLSGPLGDMVADESTESIDKRFKQAFQEFQKDESGCYIGDVANYSNVQGELRRKEMNDSIVGIIFSVITLDTLRRKSKSGWVLPDKLSPYYWLSSYVPKCMEFEVNLFGVRFL